MLLPISEAARRLRQWGAPALYHDALNGFAAAFSGEREVIFVRAPGRVNVIGEHTDYNGLPVMPVALDREIVICLSARADNQVRLTNVDVRFEPVRFALSGSIDPYQTGHWANYAKAAAQALWQWVEQESPAWLPLRGLSGCVAGNIPPGSGLSSSSALVVAAAVALVEVNSLPIRAAQLADLLARGERYVGTEGGGMDQAVSLLAEAGSALKIDFFPLRTRPVRLPVDHLLVVANTMVSANKTGGARVAYNTRVAECRLGVELLKAISRKQHPDVEDAALLSDIVRIVPEWRDALEQMPSSAVSLSEVADMTGLTQEELTRRCLVRRDGGLLPVPEQGFQPKRRCRHVLTEGNRVERAARAAESNDARSLGVLMNESHESCARDYEVSCPELDHLVSDLRRGGALGARLTGAGFGGCAVGLVESLQAQALIDFVWDAYYDSYLPTRGISTPTDRDAVLFACTPSPGAGTVVV